MSLSLGVNTLSLEYSRKLLYSNTFCAYKDKYNDTIICRHQYGYGICDLDLCPIANNYFANIIFKEDGVYLVTKKPSEKYVAGEWELTRLEINSIDDYEKIRHQIIEKIDNMPEKIKHATLTKLDHIFQRWKFLLERKKGIGILAAPTTSPEEERKEESGEEPQLEVELEKELENIE